MTHHQHVEMLVNGVLCIWPGRVGTAWNDIGNTTAFDDIRSVSTTSAFTVVGVNGSALERF